MIESVDKLRDYASRNQRVSGWMTALNRIADEIEEEFALYSLRNYPKPFGSHEAMHMVLGTAADNFDTPEEAVDYMSGETSMPLPVDADGVPICEGDVIQFVNEQGGTGAKVEVCAISKHYAYYGEGKHFYKANMCRHVKPRTLEYVLEEFGAAFEEEADDIRPLVDRYAEEIRELLGGDAE